jgi:serine/threonine protein kinase
MKVGNPYEYDYSSDEEQDSKQHQILGGKKLITTVLDFLDGKKIDPKVEKALLYYLMKSKKCDLSEKKSACEISKGAFGKAYKLQEEGHTIVVKVPRLKKKTNYGFDTMEADFQDMAYLAFTPNFPHDYIPIAKSLGYWESPSLAKFFKPKTNFCFAIDYIDSLAPFSKLVGKSVLSTRDFRGLLLQCAIALHTMQTKIQGFCHNDLHGYNILVVKGNTHKTYKVFGKAFTAGKYQIKIIDFGMATSLAETTYDGKKFHLTRGNPAVDFLQICNKCVLYGYRFMEKNQDRKPDWLGSLLQFMGRFFPNELIKNGNGSDTEGKWLHKSFVSVKHPDGIKWINTNYPPKSYPLKKFILDPFFDPITREKI